MAGRDVTDFVEKTTSPPSARANRPCLVGPRIGKRTGFVAKKAPIREACRERRAQLIAMNGFPPPLGEIVDCSREQFLAGTAGSFNQNGAIALSDLGKDFKDFMNCPASSDDVGEPIFRFEFLSQFLHEAQVRGTFPHRPGPALEGHGEQKSKC